MSYTKKKIVVELSVPEGATHYQLGEDGLEWAKLESGDWSWWSELSSDWTQVSDIYAPENPQPIEVIE